MVKKGSTLQSTDRVKSPARKLLYGTDTDRANATHGIVGKMRDASAGFTGIAPTSMNAVDILYSPSQYPAVDVFLKSSRFRSRKVHPNPPLIIKFTVTWEYYLQAEDLDTALEDLEYFQLKTAEFIQKANNSSNSTFADFGVPSFIYFIDDSNIRIGPPVKMKMPWGGRGLNGNVACEITVRSIVT